MKLNKNISLIFLAIFACSHLAAQESGPAFIAATLEADSVYYTPSYEFNNDYQDYALADNIRGLWMDGLDYNGHKTKVWCWYGVPADLQEGEKAPAVVVVHGGGGTAFADWVKKWTDHGYIAIAIAHEGQMPGEKANKWYNTWEYSGPRRAGFFKDASKDVRQQWFYHAIADAMMANSLLRSFPEVDTTNIGINGISWGGVLTNVITGIDHRFNFSIPVYGCAYLYDSPKYGKDMARNTLAEKTFYYQNWDPSLYIPLQDLPVFYVNGNNDKQFAMNIATRTYKAIPSEKYLRVQDLMKHSTRFGYAPEEIYTFADYITADGLAPVTVTIDELAGNKLFASYDRAIDKAILYYTTDTLEWVQNSYKWHEQAAQIDHDNLTIEAKLPAGSICYYINVLTQDSAMYSSPMCTISNK